jgi:hypothetical protein
VNANPNANQLPFHGTSYYNFITPSNHRLQE